MTVVKGNVDDSEGKNNPENNDTNKELLLKMEIMQKELFELKQNNKPQDYHAPAGMNPQQFIELVAAVSKASKEKPDDQKLSVKRFVDERDIDPKDFDKDGVLFCAYSTGYFITDDVRQGFPVSTPYGNDIFFKFQGQNKSRDSRGREVLNTYCAYLSRSKKEQQWLREHRYYGIKFFESATEAMSTDAVRAQKLARFIDAVMSMDQHQVVMNCQAYKVPVSENMRAMRITLASRMLDATEDPGEVASKKALKELDEENLFLADKSKMTPRNTTT
jgi:hypothetical protein